MDLFDRLGRQGKCRQAHLTLTCADRDRSDQNVSRRLFIFLSSPLASFFVLVCYRRRVFPVHRRVDRRGEFCRRLGVLSRVLLHPRVGGGAHPRRRDGESNDRRPRQEEVEGDGPKGMGAYKNDDDDDEHTTRTRGCCDTTATTVTSCVGRLKRLCGSHPLAGPRTPRRRQQRRGLPHFLFPVNSSRMYVTVYPLGGSLPRTRLHTATLSFRLTHDGDPSSHARTHTYGMDEQAAMSQKGERRFCVFFRYRGAP